MKMQKLFVVQMHDVKTDTWSVPHFVPSVAGWKRAVQDEINNPESKHEWAKHPQDFVAYTAGAWEDHNNVMYWKEQPEHLCVLSDLRIEGAN